MASDRTRTVRGALAGAIAAGIWAAQQPLDKRIFGVDYDDAELIGTAITRNRRSRATMPLGLAGHLLNGAVFGAAYANVAGALGGPRALRGAGAGLAEHLATWPLTRLLERAHPIGDQLPQLWGSHAAFAQATWRHLLFGAVLGEVEGRLNPPTSEAEPAAEAASTNGHGNVEHLVVARTP
jgi:hypothetical protein